MPAPKRYPDELRERGVRLALESNRPIRLHSLIGDIPPVEFEQGYAERVGVSPPPGSTRPTGSLHRAAGSNPNLYRVASRCRTSKPHNPVSVRLGMVQRRSPGESACRSSA